MLMKILIVDDERDYLETMEMLLSSKGYKVTAVTSSNEALQALEKEYFPIVLTDVMMPIKNGIYLLEQIKKIYDARIQVIIVTGYGSIENAVDAMKKGAFGYFIKSRNPSELLAEIKKAEQVSVLQFKETAEKEKNAKQLFIEETKSPRMLEVIETLRTVAQSTANVLITGESGVGKEVFAHYVHLKSNRSERVFIPVNCQAMSDQLIESELFGHEKGSFTGAAHRRIGRFEAASGGTIFLDEIGELSKETQVKLLRILDTKNIERIGSNNSIAVDFRLITATNRTLSEAVEAGCFREDLYFRINTIVIEIPPLRQRQEDIEAMIYFFIQQYSQDQKKPIKEIDGETMTYLLNYDYPGNVREMKNIIERLIVLSQDGLLKMKDFKKWRNDPVEENTTKTRIYGNYKEEKSNFEKRYIHHVLSLYEGNITRAAKHMAISRRQLFNKLTQYDIR